MFVVYTEKLPVTLKTEGSVTFSIIRTYLDPLLFNAALL